MNNNFENLGPLGLLSPEERDTHAALVPNEEHEFVYAKSFLQQCSTETGENLYDHLSKVLNLILSERPQNVVDFFEEYSRKVKERQYRSMNDHFEDVFVASRRLKQAKNLMLLLKPLPLEEPSTLDPDDIQRADMSNNNLLELLFYLEHSGLGLPKTEMYCLTMSIKKLIRTEPIISVKFWGKIFGLYKNFLILEAELTSEEHAKRNDNYAVTEDTKIDSIDDPLEQIKDIPGEDIIPKLWETLPPIPKIQYEPPPEPPSEPSGVGVNKKVYYVCNKLGEPWIQLPDLNPAQIRTARQIYKHFTGNLDQPILSFPYFLGTEKNYLRAQIARISAATHIAPAGFYSFGEEMEGEGMEEEEEVDKSEIKENQKYEPVSLKDLIDNSMRFWVHFEQNILNQGRTSWWNPNPLPEALDEELGEEEEIEEKPLGPEPETGPALLTPCSEDVIQNAVPAWSVRSSSNIAEEFAVAVVRSNFWPGAYTFATQSKKFQNVYFGNGLKFKTPNFSPMPLPFVEQEYQIGPEILEIFDPSGADEEAWRIAHLPKEIPKKKEIGEEEIEEEEEEEDEDEDEDD